MHNFTSNATSAPQATKDYKGTRGFRTEYPNVTFSYFLGSCGPTLDMSGK